jgi:hypothetical protein
MEELNNFDKVRLVLDDKQIYQVLGHETFVNNKRYILTDGEEMVYKFREEIEKVPDTKKNIGFKK